MFRAFASGAVVAGLLLGAGAALSQDFSARRISDDVRTISADEFQGRYPGSAGERMTLAWLQSQYEAMGLEPGGPDGQWLQPVRLERFTPVEGAASAGWTGPDGAVHPLIVGEDVTLRAATNDGQASIADAPLVFAGYGITAPERNWDDYGDIDVRGKVVVVVGGEPPGALFNGAYGTNYESGAYKADEAFRRGAVGLVTVVRHTADSPMWRRTTQFGSRTRTLTPGAADLEFAMAVNHDVALQWAAAAGLDIDGLTRIDSGAFKAVPLNGVTLSAEMRETSETLVTHNLLARIPGTERPDETVIYSAHWDHVGGEAQHPDSLGDKIFNGAWDNASGTAGVVEMARQLSRAPRPERSIVFAHMAAEEMGLIGAYGYVADPVYPLETTVADINIDMLPLSGPTRDVPIFGKGQTDLEDRLQALAAPLGRYVSDDGMPEEGFYYRSDHLPFARAGVPAIMPWHGWDWVEGGREAGEAAWRARFAAVYHKPSDEWSADWNLTSAVENLTLLYHLGLDLANSGDWPGWKPTSEFAQVRARTAPARQ
ncbi:M28 family peptidase [uncultured Brevundimonas sp.]|uniref:M28 family peptidase n=1 Tax=uncultured Brevundimonas sp. TaxID=213418 RepID=UPI0026398300|nr:M28 family peptidase [uncultured Brevundimonas sp.]